MGNEHRIPTHAWVIAGSLAVADRPGANARSGAVVKRANDLAWWIEQGVTSMITTTPRPTHITEYSRYGFNVRWYPLGDTVPERSTLDTIADEVASLLATHPGAVMLHGRGWDETLASIFALLRLRYGYANQMEHALEQTAAAGLPVGDFARCALGAERVVG